jgi:hypothetical protein
MVFLILYFILCPFETKRGSIFCFGLGLYSGVLSQATKNKTFTSENICSSASKGRSHREYLA